MDVDDDEHENRHLKVPKVKRRLELGVALPSVEDATLGKEDPDAQVRIKASVYLLLMEYCHVLSPFPSY